MIKANLIRRENNAGCRSLKWSVCVLLALMVIQLLAVGLRYHEMTQQQKAFAMAEQQLSTLKSEAAAAVVNEDLQQLAGKVAARNNWLLDRRNSPLARLAKLQKDCPNDVSFVAYVADLVDGKIILTAPDLNSVSSWLNRHFGNHGNISVVGRESNLLVLQFVWSG